MSTLLKVFLLVSGCVSSLSLLRSFAAAQTAEKLVGLVRRNADGQTAITDDLKKRCTINDLCSAAGGGLNTAGSFGLHLSLMNVRIDLLRSDLSRFEAAKQDRIIALETKNTALEGELKEMKQLLQTLRTDVTEQRQSLSGKRCEPGLKSLNVGNPQYLTFSAPFATIPVLTWGLTHLDTSNSQNTRLVTSVSNIGIRGFDVSVTTWGGSTVYGVTISWMACAN